MLREVIDERSSGIVRGFRHRGHHHVSRIESFSDAVFGFSLTLLVVSLQVPRSFADLRATVAGFPAFAITFAFLTYIWYLQYRFFRRYALEDAATITLNAMLLFVIVFFTYPLKFMFAIVLSRGSSAIGPHDVLSLFALYDSGYAAVFTIFLLLYAHAFRSRAVLALSPLELFDTTAAMWRSALNIAVAGLSFGVTALLCAEKNYGAAAIAGGLAYYAVPLGETVLGFILGKRRRSYELRTHENGAPNSITGAAPV